MLSGCSRGLLRSIITQILERHPQLLECLGPALENIYSEIVTARGLGDLQSEVESLFAGLGAEQLQEEELTALLLCRRTRPDESNGRIALQAELRQLLGRRNPPRGPLKTSSGP